MTYSLFFVVTKLFYLRLLYKKSSTDISAHVKPWGTDRWKSSLPCERSCWSRASPLPPTQMWDLAMWDLAIIHGSMHENPYPPNQIPNSAWGGTKHVATNCKLDQMTKCGWNQSKVCEQFEAKWSNYTKRAGCIRIAMTWYSCLSPSASSVGNSFYFRSIIMQREHSRELPSLHR